MLPFHGPVQATVHDIICSFSPVGEMKAGNQVTVPLSLVVGLVCGIVCVLIGGLVLKRRYSVRQLKAHGNSNAAATISLKGKERITSDFLVHE